MLSFALKNMAIKKVQIILIVLSIVISGGVSVLAFNVASQVSDGITQNAGYYSVIIGPAGSQTQLAMNTMYFAEEPIGTIPYSLVSELSRDQGVNCVIPFAMADNYNGYDVVGTTTKFLDGKSISSGRLFNDATSLEVVVGYNVAKYNKLKIGDVIYTSHSAGSADTHTQGLTVVGILDESHSSFDNVVFTQIRTLWQMHDHGHDDEDNHEETEEGTHESGEDGHEHEGGHGSSSAQGHSSNTVCAILINTKDPGYAMQLVEKYDGKTIEASDGEAISLQAIEPMSVVRDVLSDTDDTKYIVFVLCAVILVMNVMIISIITLLNMYHSSKEISLMRLIGISMKRINLLYLIQNAIIGLISILLAFGVSRLCLLLMNDYVSSMGVVLNMGKVYGMELLILAGIFLISVLPTLIWTLVMSRRDAK